MSAQMVKFMEGWAVIADTWMVCASTHDEALRRYGAADLHGEPYPKRLPRWVTYACWMASIYVAAIGIIDGGGRLNAAGFFTLAVLGALAALARPEFFLWVGFTAELGYLPLDQTFANWIFQVVSRRADRGSIVLTSNRGFGDWGQVFADPVVAAAIVDRLLGNATVVNIRGQSYRMRSYQEPPTEKGGTAIMR